MVEKPLSERRSKLSAAKRALLEQRLRGAASGVREPDSIPPRPDRERAPLSFAQQRLWFISQMEPDNPAYTLPVMVRLRGALDVAALERALGEVVRRHEVLRTTFSMDGAEPVQQVWPPQPLDLSVVDLSPLPEAEREAEARRLANEDRRRPFDLMRGPVFRATLLRLGAEDHGVFFTLHHVVCDGWSVGVLAREVVALYEAFAAGRPSPLEELPIQYADYAAWERARLGEAALEAQLDYWKKQLAGAPSLIELPTDRPRPAVQTLRGATLRLDIPRETADALKRLTRSEDTTLFVTLLAAFKVLLRRYTGQEDVVVGAPIAGRERPETEGLIGFFVNTLVLRTDLSGDPTFVEALRRVRETTLGAFAHRELPFDRLVEELKPERSRSYAPLFQVAFGFDPRQREEEHAVAGALSMTVFGTDNETAKFDLVQLVAETEDGLTLTLHYSTDLFDETTVGRLLGHFRTLLEGVGRDPQRPVSALPLLPEAERRQLLSEWNDTAAAYPSQTCLHQLFEERAARAPHRTALVFGDRRLTYDELNRSANRVAHHLRGLGVGPEVLVGLCTERSIEMVVGLLGILKAGGAYVPLDPSYPMERLSFIIADASMPVLLTQEHLLDGLPAHWGRVVCLDADSDLIEAESDETPANLTTPDNLAYAIYTSGSTGQPKGVVLAHRGLLNMGQAQARVFALGDADRVLQFASLSFDASVFEVVMSFVAGATLHLAPREEVLPGDALLGLLRDQRITIVTLPPSALALLPDAELPDLTRIIVAGEACGAELVGRWARGGRRFFNAYGPTEATVWSSVAECADPSRKPDIGRPIENVRLYVLERGMQPAPVGVAGELYVGGAGLARGYLGRPALTAEKFIPDPFASEPGARLYRTGDLARFHSDGNVEFLGRADYQVKVRGFRIEAGEVEAALLAHKSVREVVVMAREDEPGDKRLVAYVGHGGDAAPSVEELRGFLRLRLPDYMVPAAFVFLEALPLSPNGKVDRRALPAPGHERPDLDADYVAPRDAVEEMLAAMWRDTLGVEQIGVRDDFFNLGGDSIKGAVFINSLQKRLDDIIHVVTIFNASTLEQLAVYLREQHAEALVRIGVVEPERAAGDGDGDGAAPPAPRVTAGQLALVRQLIRPLPPRAPGGNGKGPDAAHVKNPPAVFVLSPPRSGSTLFRVMLAGHPALFSPPELELLSFNTLADRRAAFSGPDSFWLEGTLRALMEVRGSDAAQAKELMRAYEDEGLTTKEFYRLMQEWLGERRLVDKTPSYALHPSILRRAEEDFEGALYIHLLRHPLGMIRSFEEAKLDQLFFRYEHPFTRRELAELTWLVCHQNILEFLRRVPEERQHRVVFEELVREPERVTEGVCRFLGLEPHPDMLQPYAGRERRMTDGIYAESRMLGDVKFHSYRGIEAGVGERWKQTLSEDSLGDLTRELAEALGYGRRDGASARAPLGPAPLRRDAGATRWPLSFAQQRLWFLDQLQPGSPLYNLTAALRMRGRLDASALGATLDEIVRRHEVLRTTFVADGGRPVQVVHPASPLELALHDLSAEPEADREARAHELASRDAVRPFDLSRGPLLRATLLKLGDEEHVAVLTLHHIIGDGWSMGVLIREVATLYSAYTEGRESPLPELEIQYADFVAWQREWLQGEALEAQLSYWRRQLAGAPALLELPTDRPRPAVQTHRGDYVTFAVPVETARALRRMARDEGVTLFMALLAAWQLLLSRYTGQEDVVVGTAVANRTRPEVEPLIGFFVNTLALRTRLSGVSNFRELLAAVREVCLGAYAHQDVPFEKLVEELQPVRGMSHTPLFQVTFGFENANRERLELPGLELEPLPSDGGQAKFDLSIGMSEDGEAFAGLMEYSTELFDAGSVERMAAHFTHLLASATADPERTLGTLPVLTPAERRQQLVEWNDTRREYTHRGRLVHQLVAAQAERAPERTAVVSGARRISYGELDVRANRLAHHLRASGVGHESTVAVCLPRSIESVVATLAVWKAGAAYVPLDPEYPAERLAFMLEDAGARVVVTLETLRALFQAEGVRVVSLDAEQEEIARRDAGEPADAARPENLAYVIYTSGSAGRPKGVMVEHRQLTNTLLAAREAYRFTDEDVVPCVAPSSFDISLFELFAPLTAGARALMLGTRDVLEESTALGVLEDITFLHASTGLMRQFVHFAKESRGPGGYPHVRELFVGGDAVSPELLAQMREAFPAAQLSVGYGPTEAAIMCARYALSAGERVERNMIGRPLGNFTLRVCDARGELVPVGVVGEIYIGGEGVARGYLHSAALTAERFVPDVEGAAGSRLYRTGDLGRWLPGGAIEFVGRADGQVKVRGFRIESREVETALLAHEHVGECAVIARADGSGEKRLLAYVVAREGLEQPAAAELREHLRRHLPEYMIPSAFVPLERMPLTSLGKIDRRALPEPGAPSVEEYVAPATPVEEMLAAAYAEVLGAGRVGAGDDFFALGGHSLLATQVMSRVRRGFGVEVPLRELFEHPTVRGLARSVERLLGAGESAGGPEAGLASREGGATPLSFAQQRLWFLDQLEPGNTLYNMPTAVRLSGRLDVPALSRTLTEVCRRHEVLRTTFGSDDGQPVQVIHPPKPLPLPLLDLSALPAAERESRVRELLEREFAEPFDLAEGPLLRATLLKLGDEEHVAILTMHHIIGDGWSMGVLIKEVAALYEAFAAGRPSPLAELPVQYADFAAWQRGWLQGDALEAQLGYWRRQLAGAPSALELPTDRPRPAVPTFRGAYYHFTLPHTLRLRLQSLSRSEGVTLFMTLLAGWQLLLARYSGQEDVVVGTPIANRNRAEIEPLIGFFVNTLALRADLSGSPSFRELVGRVREVALGAYAHQDVPFEKLVEELQPERSLSHAPLFQVMFALQNTPGGELRLPGLTLSETDGNESRSISFELNMILTEAEEGLSGLLIYHSDLYDEATVARMVGHYERLLEAAAASEGEVEAMRAPLLGESEREELRRWNETGREWARAPRAHEMIEEQARLRPAHAALESGGEELSFAELNARANRLARHLQAAGAGAEVRVGLCVGRSAEMAVGMLAIWKAGAAYVPLDPEYPDERLAFMLEDADVSIVVTRGEAAGRLSASGARVISLDGEREQIDARGGDDLEVSVDAGQLAYVIYTSGSTGRPKGVMVEHRQLSNTLLAAQEVYRFTPDDVVPWIAPFTFDISLFELLNVLAAGGKCLLLDTREALDAPVARKVLEEVTFLHAAPGLMQQFIDFAREWKPGGYANVRQACAGGDRVTPDLLRGMREAFPSAQINVGYGPTEAAIMCANYPVPPGREVGHAMIGAPMANSVLHLFDRHGNLVPVGVPGELYIGGAGVARGYLKRDELTREKFVHIDGERFYRSGDLGRRLPDGNIAFAGRIDQQVKVRGYRVEVGEVEAALCAHECVGQAVVTARADGSGEKRLVAYVVAEEGLEADAAELRRHLSGRLPDYMVPAAFVFLDEIPLTAEAKVDHRALPEPEQAAGAEAAYVAPGTPVEEMLAGAYAEVLGAGRVGAGDDFFALGGHSLLATQVMSRVRRGFGVEVPLRELFEHPTVAGFAARVEAALASKEGVEAPPVTPAPRDEQPPLSFAQQRLWFIDQFEPGSSLYNNSHALRLKGVLDVAALGRTLTEIVRRHEVLRTTFAAVEGSPVQLIHPPGPFTLPLIDLTAPAEGEREALVTKLAAEEWRRPFDLARGPVLRASLLKLDDDEHVVLFTMHHIASDGWSVGVLIREVAALYAAFAEGKESPLEELPVQYADFAAWQRGWLQGEALEAQLSYWRRQLEGAPSVLELPTDRPRPSVQTHNGSHLPLVLSDELAGSLKALSRREGVTLFMTLLAAFQLLLSRYSGQEDVVVGTPIANRNRAEVEPLIGFFVNTLALRTKLEPALSFRELLRRVRETCLGAYAHQDLPFEKLVEELQPERSLSHAPFFQVVFSLENVPLTSLSLPSLEVSGLGELEESTKFDLSVTVNEVGERLGGFLTYNTDLFEAETVERMGRHFIRLLEAVAADSAREVSALPLLSEAEREEMLAGWNRTGREYPGESRVEELFERQARLSPEAVAVECGGESVSYAELDERAGRLARRLRGLGVAAESRVGVCLPRSPELIVALLGILKAGGAYVPLDPSYPAERLALMLEDSGVTVTVTDAALLGALPERHGATLRIDAAWESAEAGAEEEGVGAGSSRVEPGGEGLAYVMYTSGSTGRPKGVCVTHRAISRLVVNTDYVRLDPTDRVAQVSNPSFDAATFEIWGALLNGGRVVVLDREATLSPRELAGRLRERGVTAMFLTTALFNQVVGEEPGALATLRHVLFGGEAVDAGRVRECLEGGAPGRLLHVYGPTETTTFASWHEVRGVEAGAGAVPIGRPLANTELYVLDSRMEPAPVGVEGEVYVGGPGLARGYLGRAGLTAERFVPHPHSPKGGERLYRTGDVGRWTQRGELVFVGRRDGQVKVRGFRVEVGEVESALSSHPEVRQCAVVAREEGQGGSRRLVAYVVSGADSPPTSAALREHLLGRLPEYMVPSQFVQLDSLPLNANGKVDRRSLPESEPAADFSGEYEAPRSPAEELVAGLWAEVLKVGRVGAHDDFFALGGHSLLAARVVNRMKEVFEVEIPLRDIFERPTVAGIVERIEGYVKAGYGVEAPPITRAPRDEPLPLSFAQQRLWFMHQLEPDSPFYNSPCSLSLEGVLDTSALEATLNEILRRHEILRTQYEVSGDEPVQVITPPTPMRIPLVDLTALPEGTRREAALKLAASEMQQPFDLSRAPMFRVRLLRLAETEHMLLFTMHHIVTDLGSMGVLIKEVAALYSAYTEGRPSPLPEFNIQYADYAYWQRRWLRGEVMEQYLAYWRRRLGGTLPVLNLPTDMPRPPVQTFNGRAVTYDLTPGLGAPLQSFSVREGCTVYMTLLTAFMLLLSRRAGQEDVLVGTAIANRPHAELERLMGFFVNMLVVRADLAGNPTFRELLSRVKESTLGAYAHQEMPFERLVEEFAVKRAAGHPPLVQVAFGVRHPQQEGLLLPGLELKSVFTESDTGRFDLTLWVVITGDELRANWIYNVDLFEAETIRRLSGQFDTLLQSILAQPDARLSRLRSTSAEEDRERDALLHEQKESNAQQLRFAKRRRVSTPPVVPPGAS